MTDEIHNQGAREELENESVGEKMRKERDAFIASIKGSKPCIMVAGPTGAGKSTLINTVMKNNIAKVGTGRPVTQSCDMYENEFVRFYDTKGYESSEQAFDIFKKDVLDIIEKYEVPTDGEVRKTVDVVWYCVSAGSGRFTDFDASLVRGIDSATGHKPIAVVLTKQDHATDESAEALRRAVRQNFPEDVFGNIEIFETFDPSQVTAEEAAELNRALNGASEGLFQWTRDHLDESYRRAFDMASRRGFDNKEKQCDDYIKLAVASAATVAASPIPFSDAPLLAAAQLALMAKILTVWGIGDITDKMVGTASTALTTYLGRSLAANLVKLIPGIGTALGTTINASVASGLTYAYGKATVAVCRKINELNLNQEGHFEKAEAFFNSEFGKMLAEALKTYLGGNNGGK
ncbi:MAG: 50S ribosome-binding GTPase [Succinivibrionaceae bacterium]|nr:50S ribosome-binding GTPase [Succinivibrionaceae bacterium]